MEICREIAADIVCVLLDLMMPHLDGEEAFCEVRRIQPDAKVVLCSGCNMGHATARLEGRIPMTWLRCAQLDVRTVRS